MAVLPPEFYDRPVVEVAADLLGCSLRHGVCEGVIVETEAYHESEPASHAYRGLRPHIRNLFGAPGTAYVYRSYGIHALVNAVCEAPGVGAAVLIRALQPIAGIELMRRRRGRADAELCAGPGRLTAALGIGLELDGAPLQGPELEIHARPAGMPHSVAAKRVGITRATELPWRFAVADSAWVSRPRP
jgi:DNA-3-methyladenine glycosylase